MNAKPKIVVLGAGYGGMMTARKLTQTLSPEEAEIVLVNKHNYHYESTWLHEVAAGTINHNQARIMLSEDRKSTRLNSSHVAISYAVFCLKKKKKTNTPQQTNK